ncbi:MAG: replication-associated recombination protein A, partial [Raoultibacter sp.]
SRSRVIELHSLADDDVARLLDRALGDARGLKGAYTLDAAARAAIVGIAGGDGRAALTTLELAASLISPGNAAAPTPLSVAQVEAAMPHRGLP